MPKNVTIAPEMATDKAIGLIESATGTIKIEPGVYHFRFFVGNSGVEVIGDPESPPVFDYAGKDCQDFPGSSSGWLARYAWIIQADDVSVENVVICNATGANVRGLFPGPLGVVDEPARAGTMPKNVMLHNVSVYGCNEGLAATGENLVFDECHFFDNGILGKVSAIHNAYVQGGEIYFRNCNFGKALSGQQINSRAKYLEIDNCDFDEVGSFMFLMNSPKADAQPGQTIHQQFILKNSRLIGSRSIDGYTLSKVLDIDNQATTQGLYQELVLENNIFRFPIDGRSNIVSLFPRQGTERIIVKASGNEYHGGFGNYFRYRSSAMVKGDPMYDFHIEDHSDGSIPVTPLPTLDLDIEVLWEQEITETLGGWKLFMDKKEIADIPYAAGKELTAQRKITFRDKTTRFVMKAYNKYSKDAVSSDSNEVEVEVDLPNIDLTPPPPPTNLRIRVLS